jgi:hypothetical protein
MKPTDEVNAAIDRAIHASSGNDRAIHASSGKRVEARQAIAVYWMGDQDIPWMVVNPDVMAVADPELFVNYLLSGRASPNDWDHVKLLSKRFRSRLSAKPINTTGTVRPADENESLT